MNDFDIICESCGCTGNEECNYPPTSEEKHETCSTDRHGVCHCCRKGINRMKYRPEEDGQLELLQAN